MKAKGLRVANLLLSSEFLLELLDFKGGRIRNVCMDFSRLDTVILTIEHPSLAELSAGSVIENIIPACRDYSSLERIPSSGYLIDNSNPKS